MRQRWVVAGGGFPGIAGAALLARAGHRVTLVDAGARLGGVLDSTEWNGYDLDKGCHLFDNQSDAQTRFLLELMQGRVVPVRTHYASRLGGRLTIGAAIPDLRSLGAQAVARIRDELPGAPGGLRADLASTLEARFGPTAGTALAQAAAKGYGVPAADLDGVTLQMSLFQRALFLDDAEALAWKARSPDLDDRVAALPGADPMRFYRARAGAFPARNFYPAEHGMRGFVEAAHRYLTALGVDVRVGAPVESVDLSQSALRLVTKTGVLEADRMLWTLGPAAYEKAVGAGSRLVTILHGVPMLLHYYGVPAGQEGPYTYVHDFDAAPWFRLASPGAYGRANAPAGRSYVMAECPVPMGSADWDAPADHAARTWDSLHGTALVHAARPDWTHTLRAPVTYRVPRKGAAAAVEQFFRENADSRVIQTDPWDFSKTAILDDLAQALEVPLDAASAPRPGGSR